MLGFLAHIRNSPEIQRVVEHLGFSQGLCEWMWDSHHTWKMWVSDSLSLWAVASVWIKALQQEGAEFPL